MPIKDKGTDKGLSLAANTDNVRFEGRQDNRPIKRSRVHVSAPRTANEIAEVEKGQVYEMKTAARHMFSRQP
jgi:hypothetical protein